MSSIEKIWIKQPRAALHYASSYDDVLESGEHPFWHYLHRGRWEGREWHSCLDTASHMNCEAAKNRYLRQHPDVLAEGLDARHHFDHYGQYEGRSWPECKLAPRAQVERPIQME